MKIQKIYKKSINYISYFKKFSKFVLDTIVGYNVSKFNPLHALIFFHIFKKK